SPALFVAPCDGRRIEVGAQETLRRARSLDLGDDRRTARGDLRAHRADKVARRCGGSRPALDLGRRDAALGGRDLLLLDRDDALEDVAQGLRFLVNAMKSSSFFFAAPLAMTSRARSTPAFMLGAMPDT